MIDPEPRIPSHRKRLTACLRNTIPKTGKVSMLLIKAVIPISLAVKILELTHILPAVAGFIAPIFELFGLSGNGAIVFINSLFSPLYASLAIMSTMAFTMREATILAVMCLISHALPIEAVVQKKAGSGLIEIIAIRIIASLTAALLLNLIAPAEMSGTWIATAPAEASTLMDEMQQWSIGTLQFIARIVLIVFPLIFIQQVMDEYLLMAKLSPLMSPLMRLCGLPSNCGYLWLIGNFVGLIYGGAIIIELTERGVLKREESRLVNRHLGISHSIVEDTMIFASCGILWYWLLIPRFLLAIGVVWLFRGINKLRITLVK